MVERILIAFLSEDRGERWAGPLDSDGEEAEALKVVAREDLPKVSRARRVRKTQSARRCSCTGDRQ